MISEETLKEAKRFKVNCGVFAVILYILMGFMIYLDEPKTTEVLTIIGMGAVCLTWCYFSMRNNIKDYEKELRNYKGSESNDR